MAVIFIREKQHKCDDIFFTTIFAFSNQVHVFYWGGGRIVTAVKVTEFRSIPMK